MKKISVGMMIIICATISAISANSSIANSPLIFYEDGFIFVDDYAIKRGGLNPDEPIYLACGEKPGEGPVGNEWLQTHNYKHLWEDYRLIRSGNYWKVKIDKAFLNYGYIRCNLVQIKANFGNIWFDVHAFKNEPWYNQSKGDILLSFEN